MTSDIPHVLAIISHLAVGGAENVAINLAETAKGRVKYTFFMVLARTPDPKVADVLKRRLEAVGSSIYFGSSVPFKRGGVLVAAWRLRVLIQQKRPDLIHVHTEMPELTLATAALGMRKRSPVVIRTVHNTKLWSDWEAIGRWVTRRLSAAVTVGVSAAACSADAQFKIESGLPAAVTRKAVLIYNGVRPPIRKRSLRDKATGSRDGKSSPIRILFAGRFEYQKGVDLLPAIVREAADLHPAPVELTLAGGGALRAQVKADLESRPLAWRVMFCDAITDLGQKIHEYDLVLMPSRFEGLGLVAVEAALAAVPVLAFAAPGLIEVVPSSSLLSVEAGNTIEFAKKISRFLEDPSRFNSSVAELQDDCRGRFSLESMVDAYIRLYELALGEASVHSASVEL